MDGVLIATFNGRSGSATAKWWFRHQCAAKDPAQTLHSRWKWACTWKCRDCESMNLARSITEHGLHKAVFRMGHEHMDFFFLFLSFQKWNFAAFSSRNLQCTKFRHISSF